jgi:hypothetical protein
MSLGTASDAQPRRILFCLYHAGYLRHYRASIALLAEQGHVIHLAFTALEKDAGDARLAEELDAAHPTVTYGLAPRRGRFDGYRSVARLVRTFADLTRYVEPRFADAPALRARMADQLEREILQAGADPLSRRLLRAAARRIETLTPAQGHRLRRYLARAEAAIPPSGRVDRSLSAFRPDAVVVTPLVDFGSAQVDLLKSARALGVPTAVAVASWDNLTSKGLLRFAPDRALVWNELQRRELADLHGVDSERAVVTGAAKFDPWLEREPSMTAESVRRAAGLEPSRPFVLYLGSSRFIAPDEVGFVRRYAEALRAAAEPLADLGILVRPHPQNVEQWQGVRLPEGVRLWPRAGAQPDAESERAVFYDSIFHCVAAVGVNTSAMIDAALVGRPVLSLLDPAFASTQEGTLHFHYLLEENGGFLEVARSFHEHHDHLRAILAGVDRTAGRREAFAASFVRPRGPHPVAPILADALLAVTDVTPALPERAPMLLRACLLAAAFAAVLPQTIAAVRARIRRPGMGSAQATGGERTDDGNDDG